MKRCTMLLYGLFSAFILISLTGCSEQIENIGEVKQDKVFTRALTTTDYYWYNGEKVGINRDDSKKFILFKSSDELTVTSALSNMKIVNKIQKVVLSSKIKGDKSIAKPDLKWAVIESATVTKASNLVSEILYEAPFFKTENGVEVGLSHLFYVKLKSESDVSKLNKLADENIVEVIGNNEYMPLWYTLSCSKKSTGNALELANKFYESGLFEEAQPDLMSDDKTECVNDPNLNYQWNLINSGQNSGTSGVDVRFCNTRSITTGSSSIIVAVLDQGIQLNHPDLNVHPTSYDTESGTSPSIIHGTHGTNCAGFISAKTNNGTGVASLAPDCPAMSISNSLYASPDSRQKRADGINFAWNNGASVISNSWESNVQYAIIDNAISNALIYGRSGKGTVVVFASGNGYSSSVSYPANCNSDILAVGAINRNGLKSSFSNYGTALDIVAPGEDLCTTTTGSSYIYSISGTSFACPQVAAVAALILSVNPNLTQKQVSEIIESTARKIGNYSYVTTSGRTNGTWNNEMGYGVLDAFAAVTKASNNCSVSFVNQSVTGNQLVSGCDIFVENVYVSNGATLTFSPTELITINPGFTIDAGCQLIISY